MFSLVEFLMLVKYQSAEETFFVWWGFIIFRNGVVGTEQFRPWHYYTERNI